MRQQRRGDPFNSELLFDHADHSWASNASSALQGYHGETLTRWRKTMRSAPFASLLKVPLVYTNSSHFLSVLHYPGRGLQPTNGCESSTIARLIWAGSCRR